MSVRNARPSLAFLLVFVSLGLGACAQPVEAPPGDEAAQDATGTTLDEIMVGLGEESEQITAALWTEDYATIAAAAERIAKHPNVSDAERSSIQAVLGPDMANFATADRLVHDTGLALAEAATAQDMTQVLSRYSDLQQACVACHTDYRDRLAER